MKNEPILKRPEGFMSERIESERLLLIPTTLEHKDDIFKEFTPDITTFMYPAPAKDISETEEFIKNSLKGLEDGSNLQLTVTAKDSGEFLGGGGLHHVDKKTPELGIWIKRSAHGNSYGREAMIAVKKWADANLDYDYILYPVDEENIASRKIAESLGGKVENKYDEKNQSGVTLHMIEYRIYPDRK